jgi:predicted metalloprotease with PDZ domain
MVVTAAAAEQPNTLSHPAVSGYFYIAGRAYLGVDIRDVTTDRMSALKLKDERGVEITMVDADAPAGKAGLREHDVILDFNGTAIESEEQLRRLIREVSPGRTVTLGISRDGTPMKISLQLADHSAMVAQTVPHIPVIRIPDLGNSMDIPIAIPTYSAILGAQTENLTRQLGEYFGVKNGAGVLIRSVEKSSVAEKAGLKAGDVIIRADNEKLTDRSDLNHILRSHHTTGKMTLVVMRDKHEQTITITLPDRGSRDSSRLNLGTLGLDTEDLQASLGNTENLLQDLSDNEGLLSLTDNLATLNANAGLLDMAQHIQITPEIEKAMQQAQKILEGLEIGSDPI